MEPQLVERPLEFIINFMIEYIDLKILQKLLILKKIYLALDIIQSEVEANISAKSIDIL